MSIKIILGVPGGYAQTLTKEYRINRMTINQEQMQQPLC